MPGGRGHRGRLLALAADVADGDGPAPGHREHVVEVAADLESLAGRHVSRVQVQPGDVRQRGGQQAALQRLGYLRAVPEHAVHPDGHAQVPAQFLGQAQVSELETSLAGGAGQGQRAVAGAAVGDRHAEQRGRAEQHQQRRAVRGGAEHPGVLGVSQQDGRPGGVYLPGHRPGLRVDGTRLPGQRLGRLVVGADHELAPQQAGPLDVYDHPARDVTRQLPGAALQRDRLAERAVVQQQPGDCGNHVHPARHGPDRVHRRARVAGTGRGRPGGGPGPGVRPAVSGDRQQPGTVLQGGDARQQGHLDRSVRAEQLALHLPGRPGPGGRGELALDRGAGGQVDERRQRLAGRIPGRGADQFPGLGVGPPDRAVLLEHEHGHGRVLEHRPQQGTLGGERIRPGRRGRFARGGLG